MTVLNYCFLVMQVVMVLTLEIDRVTETKETKNIDRCEYGIRVKSRNFPVSTWREYFTNGSTASLVNRTNEVETFTQQYTKRPDEDYCWYEITFWLYDVRSTRLIELVLEDEGIVQKRNITCQPEESVTVPVDNLERGSTNREDKVEIMKSHMYIAAAVSGGVIVLIIVIIAALVCSRHRTNTKSRERESASEVSNISGPRSTHPYAEVDMSRWYEGLDSERKEQHRYSVPERNQSVTSYLEPVNNNHRIEIVSDVFSDEFSEEFDNPCYQTESNVTEVARRSRFLNLFTKKPKVNTVKGISIRGHDNNMYIDQAVGQTKDVRPESISRNQHSDDEILLSPTSPHPALKNVRSDPGSSRRVAPRNYENVQLSRSFVRKGPQNPQAYENVARFQRKAKLTM